MESGSIEPVDSGVKNWGVEDEESEDIIVKFVRRGYTRAPRKQCDRESQADTYT